jgi:hypothetical protein
MGMNSFQTLGMQNVWQNIWVTSLGTFGDRGRYPTPAKTAEAYYNINTYQPRKYYD